jgi:hypothetical protein
VVVEEEDQLRQELKELQELQPHLPVECPQLLWVVVAVVVVDMQ